MNSISVLGLGIVGSRIAKHLLTNDVNVTVWNRTPKDGFPSTASSPAEAARASRVVCLYLKDRTACDEVFEAMSPALTPDHIVINHSTIDRDCVLDLASRCTDIGCAYLDAPFTGSKLAAEAGQLVYYVSGDKSLIEQAKPLLAMSSKAIIEMGDLGNATTVKLVTNLLSSTMVQGLCEAYAITRSYGIGIDKLLEAISTNVVSSPLAAFKLPYMAEENYETHFSLDNMRKDSTYVIKLAQEKGIAPPMISLVSELMTRQCDKGDGDLDYSALLKQFD